MSALGCAYKVKAAAYRGDGKQVVINVRHNSKSMMARQKI